MSQTYGIESAKHYAAEEQRKPVRYVVIIDTGGAAIARLFLETHQQVDEFDAGVPEVLQMIQGIVPTKGAVDAVWDTALRGHSMTERSAAEVYTLTV